MILFSRALSTSKEEGAGTFRRTLGLDWWFLIACVYCLLIACLCDLFHIGCMLLYCAVLLQVFLICVFCSSCLCLVAGPPCSDIPFCFKLVGLGFSLLFNGSTIVLDIPLQRKESHSRRDHSSSNSQAGSKKCHQRTWAAATWIS